MSQLKVWDGEEWLAIPEGGVGVPSGGSSGQYLKKSSSVDYATEWEDPPVIHEIPRYTTIINLLNNPLPSSPTTSSAGTTYTAPEDGLFTIFADRQNSGYTLHVYIDGIDVIQAPAYFGGIAFSIAIPLRKGDTVGLSVDGNNTWIVRDVQFIY